MILPFAKFIWQQYQPISVTLISEKKKKKEKNRCKHYRNGCFLIIVLTNFEFHISDIKLRHFFLAIHHAAYTFLSYLLFLRFRLSGSWVVWNLVLEFPFPRCLTCIYTILNFISNFHCLLYHSPAQTALPLSFLIPLHLT